MTQLVELAAEVEARPQREATDQERLAEPVVQLQQITIRAQVSAIQEVAAEAELQLAEQAAQTPATVAQAQPLQPQQQIEEVAEVERDHRATPEEMVDRVEWSYAG